ncbi:MULTISPECIES: hypothetical protein [unclassified Gilliamella]|uniref:hypothetical protein n=1 Tax=unclassified Gilliamella TaxID=2685620 RepID=UPI00080E7ED0|nr:hypothetical protein [Gilliamella apicola]OCG20553.1 hypothetical protein A9G23_06940 [Gilliamella apicola]OCG24562.1 hypothetical protein A9G22_03900 [Gilliamella apicola]
MKQDLSITFGAAYMTVEEYAKHSGMKEKTIKDYVHKGYLPIRKKNITGKRSIILINNAALVAEALADRSPTINI